jgi:hypothetical protein
MKKYIRILSVALILCFALAMPAVANVTFVVPSGIGYVIDRDGNTYTPVVATGAISVPNKYVADFLNAGYYPLYQATYLGAGATTASVIPKIYAGTGTMISGTPSSFALTSLGFSSVNYFCAVTDTNAFNGGMGFKVSIASPTTAYIYMLSPATDTVNYICVGQ